MYVEKQGRVVVVVKSNYRADFDHVALYLGTMTLQEKNKSLLLFCQIYHQTQKEFYASDQCSSIWQEAMLEFHVHFLETTLEFPSKGLVSFSL